MWQRSLGRCATATLCSGVQQKCAADSSQGLRRRQQGSHAWCTTGAQHDVGFAVASSSAQTQPVSTGYVYVCLGARTDLSACVIPQTARKLSQTQRQSDQRLCGVQEASANHVACTNTHMLWLGLEQTVESASCAQQATAAQQTQASDVPRHHHHQRGRSRLPNSALYSAHATQTGTTTTDACRLVFLHC